MKRLMNYFSMFLLIATPVFAGFEDVVEEKVETTENIKETVVKPVTPTNKTNIIQTSVKETISTQPTQPVTSLPKPVDLNTLKFSKEIKGFAYKSSDVMLSGVKGNITSVMKTILPLINKIPKEYKIKIIGHADGTGPEEQTLDKPGNIAISRMRAEAVRDYIVNNYNIPSDRFEIIAKGSSELKNKKNPASAENRRVVIEFKP